MRGTSLPSMPPPSTAATSSSPSARSPGVFSSTLLAAPYPRRSCALDGLGSGRRGLSRGTRRAGRGGHRLHGLRRHVGRPEGRPRGPRGGAQPTSQLGGCHFARVVDWDGDRLRLIIPEPAFIWGALRNGVLTWEPPRDSARCERSAVPGAADSGARHIIARVADIGLNQRSGRARCGTPTQQFRCGAGRRDTSCWGGVLIVTGDTGWIKSRFTRYIQRGSGLHART